MRSTRGAVKSCGTNQPNPGIVCTRPISNGESVRRLTYTGRIVLVEAKVMANQKNAPSREFTTKFHLKWRSISCSYVAGS